MCPDQNDIEREWFYISRPFISFHDMRQSSYVYFFLLSSSALFAPIDLRLVKKLCLEVYSAEFGFVCLDPNEMSGRSYLCTCPQTILLSEKENRICTLPTHREQKLLTNNKYNVKLCNIWACGMANKTCMWLAILSVCETENRSK